MVALRSHRVEEEQLADLNKSILWISEGTRIARTGHRSSCVISSVGGAASAMVYVDVHEMSTKALQVIAGEGQYIASTPLSGCKNIVR